MANRDYGDQHRREGWRGEEWESGPYGGRPSHQDWYLQHDAGRGRASGRSGFYDAYGYDPDERPYYGDLGRTFGARTIPVPWPVRYGSMGWESSREQHFGRGPRGYRRSDSRVEEDINDRLTWHPAIDASDIEVTVEKGEVTLSGVVEDRRAKRLAEDIAEDVFGVQDVHNHLKIRHGFLAGLTGEKADEHEVARGATRETTEPPRRGARSSTGSSSAAGTSRTTGGR